MAEYMAYKFCSSMLVTVSLTPKFLILCVGRRGAERGIPNQRMTQDNRAVKLTSNMVPDVNTAKLTYSSDGGSLSSPGIFGCDPLSSNAVKSQIRAEAFMSIFSFDSIFSDVVNANEQSFKTAFSFFVDVTYRLVHSDD